jgi:hypothetical protein
VINFAQTPVGYRVHPSESIHHLKVSPRRNTSGRMEATVHDSERYRSNAADCLSEAHERQPSHRNLNLFAAAAWLSLARQDEAMESVIASWNTPKVPEPRMAPFIFQGVLGCFGQPFLAPQMLPAFLQDRSSPKPARSHQDRRSIEQVVR